MGEVLRLANWNLERISSSDRRSVEILRYINSVDADIWVLTETHESVGPGAGFSSCFSGKPDRVSREGERWVGIWSRWAMEPLPSFVSDTFRCAAARIAYSPFGELIIFGGVLPWTNSWRGIPGLEGKAFGAALQVQSNDWMRLEEQFPDATLIVAGDFNQDLAAKHYYGSKKKRGLLEATLLDSKLGSLTSGANDPIARDSSPYACIDHICISNNIGWNLKSTIRWPESPNPVRTISDHFGVAVEVTPTSL